MRLGIFEQVFGFQGEDAFIAVDRAGFRAVQFDLASVGLETLPKSIPDGLMEQVAAWAFAHDIVIAGIHGTFNMIDPDPIARAEGLRRLVHLIERAPASSTRVVTLCTGTRSTSSMWVHHSSNAEPDAWKDLRESLDVALEAAERSGIVLGVEPEPANVIATSGLARKLLDEVGSEHLGIIADPANMLLGMDISHPEKSMATAFEDIGDAIVMAHGKDLTAEGEFTSVGRGVVPWSTVQRLLDDHEYDGSLILHGLVVDDIDQAKLTLRDAGFPA